MKNYNKKKIPINKIFIWTTEEIATHCLTSVENLTKKGEKSLPIKAINNIRKEKKLILKKRRITIPKVPSFNSKPAKIILPIVGASTWAFGNQTCKIKIGVFTKNPNNLKKINNEDPDFKKIKLLLKSLILVNKIIIGKAPNKA